MTRREQSHHRFWAVILRLVTCDEDGNNNHNNYNNIVMIEIAFLVAVVARASCHHVMFGAAIAWASKQHKAIYAAYLRRKEPSGS